MNAEDLNAAMQYIEDQYLDIADIEQRQDLTETPVLLYELIQDETG